MFLQNVSGIQLELSFSCFSNLLHCGDLVTVSLCGISYSTFAHSCQTWGEITCMIAWLSINIFYTLLLCCPRNKWYAFPQCIKGLLLIWAILINHYISQIHVHFPNLEITCHILLLRSNLELVIYTNFFCHNFSIYSLIISNMVGSLSLVQELKSPKSIISPIAVDLMISAYNGRYSDSPRGVNLE